MRALIITPTPTHPITQGNRVRVAQIAGALRARGFIVDLFYYVLDGEDHDAIAAMREAWDVVHTVSTMGYRWRRSHPAHWGLDDWVAPAPLEAVRRLAETRDYALVIANYVWCSALLEPFMGTGAKLVIDAHDAFGGRHEVAREAGMTPNWYYTSIAEETRGFDRADMVLAIQEHEGRLFAEQTASDVMTIEYSTAPIAIKPTARGKLKIGYFGSGNPWNVRSIQLFDALLAAQPDIDALLERFEFRLYGGICHKPGDYAVFMRMGFVEEVEHFYEEIDLVINPMVGGTGLKIKTVEALAFGRPIISTAAGGAGLESIHPDINLADLDALLARLRQIGSRSEVLALGEEMNRGYAAFHARTEDKIDMMLDELGLA